MNSTSRLLKILSIGWLIALGSCSGQDQPSLGDKPSKLFRKTGVIKPTVIQESSGAAISFLQPDVFWTINDSGNSTSVYCLSNNGDLIGTVELEGVSNRDWESMSRFTMADKYYLVVGDVGDNQSRYERCKLCVFQEPELTRADPPRKLKITPTTIEFEYPDGARDCECVAIDPSTNDIWLFEKVMELNFQKKPHVYRIPSNDWLPKLAKSNSSSVTDKTGSPAAKDSPIQVQPRLQGKLNHRYITGGEFSPDGNQLILRTYSHSIYFQKTQTESWVESFSRTQPILLPLPVQQQGESVAFLADSQTALVTSEGVRQPIWLIDISASLKEAKKSAAE